MDWIKSSSISDFPVLVDKFLNFKHGITTLYGATKFATHIEKQVDVCIKISCFQSQSIHAESTMEEVFAEVEMLKYIQDNGNLYLKNHAIEYIEDFSDEQCKLHFLVTRKMGNQDLCTYMLETGKLSETLAHDLFTQLLAIVGELHQIGIVHNDLSLENICIDTESKKIYLIDFGYSICTNGDLPNTLNSMLVYKRFYSTPEKILGQPYDHIDNDIYGLGVILYILVTGFPPYESPLDNVRFTRVMNSSWKKHFKLSDSVMDLIDHILKPKKQRYTFHEICHHPWVTTMTNVS